MPIGYGRVSTDDQDLSLQRAALKAAGCRRLNEEKISGAKRNAAALLKCHHATLYRALQPRALTLDDHLE